MRMNGSSGPGRLLAGILGLALLAAGPGAIGFAPDAMAQMRSSGGYSRPSGAARSGGGYGRTPSFGSSRIAPRTPSSSGGYARPSMPDGGYARRPSVGGSSAWDRAYSRDRSGDALSRMRAQQRQAQEQAQRPQRQPSLPPAQTDGGWWRGGARTPPVGPTPGTRTGRNGGWYNDRGWSPQGFPGMQRSFGLWDGVFLWFLLSNLGRAGSTDFFHNHQDDPGYRDFRAQAESRAQTDPEIRRQLDELDRRLAERQDQPRDPNYLPPDVPPEVATAPRADTRTPAPPVEEEGGGIPWLVLLGGAGVIGFLALRRRRAASSAPGTAPASPATRTRTDMAPSAPRFRLGMTITCDPTPFLLGAGSLKVPAPAFAQGDARVSVQAVGRIREGNEELTRLYLPDGRSFFQLYIDARGEVGECRYFAILDEVSPADEAEWGAWLDPQQGMIGWPEFQTQDGKLYGRHWSPGDGPVPPRPMPETIEGLEGTRQRQQHAMLYAAETGLAAPAPQVEYILVSAVEEGGRAWVEIRAGIDISPASLSLA